MTDENPYVKLAEEWEREDRASRRVDVLVIGALGLVLLGGVVATGLLAGWSEALVAGGFVIPALALGLLIGVLSR